MNLMKKGALTLYIILGLLLVVVLFFSIYLLSSSTARHTTDDDRLSIDAYVSECLKNQAELGIYSLGMHTGNIIGPTRYLIFNSSVQEHDLDHAANELILFMDYGLEQCLEMYPNKEGFQIDKKDTKIDVMFTDTKTFIKFDEMYKYTKGEIEVHSKPLEIALNVRYKLVHQTVGTLISERVANTYIYDSDALKTEGFDISVAQYNSTAELWVISDHISEINEGPFLYAYFVNLV